MRIVMMGTGPFAVPTFRWLLESAHEVPALFTRPDRNVHRRRRPPPNPMREVAQEHNLKILTPDSINSEEAHQQLRELEAELFVVCDYGQILSRDTLTLATRGGINLHGSLLPKYRGAAPVHWAIYHGEPETGVSVIHMTPRLDGGPVIATRTTNIGPDETTPDVELRLSQIGVEAVAEAIKLLDASPVDATLGEPQDQSQATKAPRLSKEDGAVDWNRSDQEIKNQVRAFQPWPGTYSNLVRDGQEPVRLILDRVSIAAADEATLDEDRQPGQVALVEKDRLLVATGEGLLSLDRVQPSGKKAMGVGDWLRGHEVTTQDRFESS